MNTRQFLLTTTYLGGNAVFQVSIEGSGNNTQTWFNAVKNNGQGSAPEG